MLSAKNILAGLLLMVYTISFGHSVIPQHHHINANGEHVEEMHCDSDEDSHQHIQHDNHLDEGIWDFLGCLIENLHQELPSDHHSCEAISIATEKVQSDRVLVKSIAIHTLKIESASTQQNQISHYANSILVKDFNVERSQFRRGPPQS